MDDTSNRTPLSPRPAAATVIFTIAAKVRAMVDAQAPEGYEDERGFHFGSPIFEKLN